jgi:hypothetical protein
MDSLYLGLAVGVGVVVLGWLLRPDPGERLAPSLRSRLVGRLALMPPLVQGVGVLTTLELGRQAARASTAIPGLAALLAPMADGLADWSVATGRRAMLILAVGLSVGTRLMVGWRRSAELHPMETRSGLDAAMIAGSSLLRARGMAALHPRRWIAAAVLAAALGAANLAPALLFVPGADGGPAAPAMLALADGPPGARLQAAALAGVVVAGHIAGLCAARLAPSPPPEWDPDPV